MDGSENYSVCRTRAIAPQSVLLHVGIHASCMGHTQVFVKLHDLSEFFLIYEIR